MKLKNFGSKLGLICAIALSISVGAASTSRASENRSPAATQAAALKISSKGDELAFDKTKLSAKPGQTVKLTFSNTASKTSGMQHNWVLLKPGTADTVGMAAMSEGPDKNYIPDSGDILAHTKMIKAGEKDTIEFKAPSTPGDYPYICTFPGHYTVMKGVLQVK